MTSKRLKISYNTALEYAKIEELLLKYENQFTNADFNEENGFKKLLFLEQALSHHEPDEVFKRIKEDSFKTFAKYAKPARAGFTPALLKKTTEKPPKQRKPASAGKWIFEENGKLYMDSNSSGTELLTFNKKFLEDEELSKEYKTFMANIILSAMDYFKGTNKKRGFDQ